MGAPVVLLAVLVAGLPGPASSSEAGDRFLFSPTADTRVESNNPTTVRGTSSTMTVDGSPVIQSFIKFPLQHIEGRTVTGVRLRMHQMDSSPLGGRVSVISSNSWNESTTWQTRPAIDGPAIGSFGAVQKGWYEVPLDVSAFTSDGPLSIAIDSTSSDSSKWSTRESATPPQLVVEVAPVDGLVVDGTMQVAPSGVGSSDPTYYSNQHRLALTSGGRTLAVHGRHSQGVQLAWRDPSSGWQTDSQGAVTDGLLLGGTGTGDWNASIATATDNAGVERAWVVWSGINISSTPKVVSMRRLTNLDAPGGPTVGPIVTVDAPLLGAARPDIAFEPSPTGPRGVITWLRRSGDTAYQLATTWFTELDSPSPAFHDFTALLTSSSQSRASTLETDELGTRLIVRNRSGRLQMFRHVASEGLGVWRAAAAGITTSSSSFPAATLLDSGEALAVVESSTSSDVVTVQRWSADGSAVTVAWTATGYNQPTIASDGTSAWIVAIRSSDRAVISRRVAGPAGAASSDVVELAKSAAPSAAYPNALRQTDGRLRFIVRGERAGSSRSSVLAYQRPI